MTVSTTQRRGGGYLERGFADQRELICNVQYVQRMTIPQLKNKIE